MPPAPARAAGRDLVAAVVGLVAAAVRVQAALGSGLLSVGRYDDGVYYAAAVDLVHGVLPYRDVPLLQPPGIALATAPFALIAQAVGDGGALATARVVFALVGGVNAALVVLLLRRWGAPAMVAGGLLDALAFPAVYVERTVATEVLGTTGLLLALLAVQRAGPRRSLLGGALAGAAIGLKVWYVLPFTVLLLCARGGAGGRIRFLVGGVLAGLVVFVPFFVADPTSMWRQVVTAQLGRPEQAGTDALRRLSGLLGVSGPDGATTPLPAVPGDLLTIVLAALVVLLAAIAWTDPAARVLVGLLASCVAVLLLSPSFLQHYAALTAAPLSLVAGAAVPRAAGLLRRPRVAAVLAVAPVALAAVLWTGYDLVRLDRVPPVDALRAAVDRVPGCVVADDPTVLAVLDRLTPDVAAGCRVEPDPSGAGYLVPGRVERVEKPAFQRAILRYLWSGDAYLWVRGGGLQLDARTEASVRSGRVLLDRDGWTLRATPGR